MDPISSHDEVDLSAGYLHRREVICEDDMTLIVIDSPIKIPFSIKWILWRLFSNDSRCQRECFIPDGTAALLRSSTSRPVIFMYSEKGL